MTEPKQESYSPGATKSDDPSDPTIYPKEGIEEQSCEHGMPSKADCVMCIEEKVEADSRAAEKKEEEDKADGKL